MGLKVGTKYWVDAPVAPGTTRGSGPQTHITRSLEKSFSDAIHKTTLEQKKQQVEPSEKSSYRAGRACMCSLACENQLVSNVGDAHDCYRSYGGTWLGVVCRLFLSPFFLPQN